MAYGLWRGKRWAWTITVILSFIGIALGAASIVTGNIAAIFHLIINALVIYYLGHTLKYSSAKWVLQPQFRDYSYKSSNQAHLEDKSILLGQVP
jgi:hypothetical protein